uniref:ARID domain-containing protein n=1 Tax=Timema poppense TaxID=170557 RepID=A0A7R9H6C3_TIMPO|nr:unnamed protein product [Timema poppensis]
MSQHNIKNFSHSWTSIMRYLWIEDQFIELEALLTKCNFETSDRSSAPTNTLSRRPISRDSGTQNFRLQLPNMRHLSTSNKDFSVQIILFHRGPSYFRMVSSVRHLSTSNKEFSVQTILLHRGPSYFRMVSSVTFKLGLGSAVITDDQIRGTLRGLKPCSHGDSTLTTEEVMVVSDSYCLCSLCCSHGDSTLTTEEVMVVSDSRCLCCSHGDSTLTTEEVMVVSDSRCLCSLCCSHGDSTLTTEEVMVVGSTCEARHPDKKEFSEATITKIQDCSQYTVVFDDGDITTLRRTALCLKSGRHFAESETLDQLPLTHPEHFSSPVVVERTGRRSRQTHFTVPKKEATEFTKEIGGKVDNNTLKTAESAVEKALLFLDKDELPPHWDRDLLFGLDDSSGNSDSDAGFDSDYGELAVTVIFLQEATITSLSLTGTQSSDDEPREEKDHFVAQLYKFMDDRGTPINKGPTIGSRDVDLYKLFKAISTHFNTVVHKLGGYNRVTNHNQWKTVSHKLGFGMSGSSVINLVKQSYKKFLHSFEDFYRKLGCTMVNHPRGNRSRHRAGRSLIRDRDRSTPINIPKDKDKSANTMAEKRTEFGDRDTQLAESKEFIEDTKKGNLEESSKLTKDLTKEEHTKKMENIEVAVDKIKEKEEKVKPKEEKLKLKEQKGKPKEEKMKPKEEKVKPKEEKMKPKEEKVNPKEEKVKPKEEKVKPKEEKVKPKEEKIKPKEEKVKPKEEKVKPKEEKLKPKEEKLNPKEEKLKPKEEKLKPKEEKLKPKEEKVKPKEEKLNPKEEKVKPKDEIVMIKEDKEDKVKLKDDKSKVLEVPKKDIEDKEERLRARETKKEDKSKEKELRGRMTELEKVVRIVLEDKGRFAQMSAAGCSTPVAQAGRVGGLNKEIKVRKEEKNKFINKEKLEEKQKIKEGDKLTTDEGENPDEIKRKVEKKTEDDEKEVALRVTHSSLMSSDRMKPGSGDWAQTRSKSKDEPRCKKDVTPVDRRTRESRSPGREFEKKPSPPSLQKTKKLDDDVIVLGFQKKRGRKRKDSEEKPRSEE